jgi:hypothetical protein
LLASLTKLDKQTRYWKTVLCLIVEHYPTLVSFRLAPCGDSMKKEANGIKIVPRSFKRSTSLLPLLDRLSGQAM